MVSHEIDLVINFDYIILREINLIGVSMKLIDGLIMKTLVLGPVTTNCYLIMDSDSKDLVVIDPGWDGEIILAEIERMGGKLKSVWLTHGHFDHLGGIAALLNGVGEDVKVCLHPDEKVLYENKGGASLFGLEIEDGPPISKWLKDGEKLTVGKFEFEVRHTPGHTTGHVIFYCDAERLLFSGDLIFQGSIGRTDLPGGSFDQIISSIKGKVMNLPDDTEILSGHGPSTSIGVEREFNPYIK